MICRDVVVDSFNPLPNEIHRKWQDTSTLQNSTLPPPPVQLPQNYAGCEKQHQDQSRPLLPKPQVERDYIAEARHREWSGGATSEPLIPA